MNGAGDLFDTYLSSLIILMVQDSFVYWHDMLCSNDSIALMALNFLSMPDQKLIFYVNYISFIFDTTISVSSTDIE